MDKEKFNLREIKNSMFKDSIGIFQGLIEFIEGLIARKKFIFEVNLGFKLKKLKSNRTVIFKR